MENHNRPFSFLCSDLSIKDRLSSILCVLTHNNLSGKTLIDRLHKNLLTFYLPRENIIKDALILKVQEIVDKKHFKLLHEALI